MNTGSRRRRDEARTALSRRSRRPAAPGDLRLSIVLPAYREPRIGDSVKEVRAALAAVVDEADLEIVVVDDGSGDETAARAREGGADHVIEMPVNRGKGAAVREGVLAARGRTIVFTDADLAYGPDQIGGLLDRVEDGWDIVVGSRLHADTETVAELSALRRIGGRAINAATRLVLAGGHEDTQCGLKAFRSDIARIVFSHTTIDGFAFDVEIYLQAERNGFSLLEAPVTVENSEVSTVNVARDALRLLADLVRIRRAERSGAYDLTPSERAEVGEAAE